MEDLSGRIIKGYEMRHLLGEGGFGAVYLAYQNLIGREVAVKIILPQYANQPDFIRRFETEAQLVARLEHPHIVPLYDYWREPSGAFLVMRYLRGGSLHEHIKKNGPVSPEQAGELITQIASALVVAHRQGVIHRDIKPENILMDENDNVYLSDFGIAKEKGRESITQQNALIGSPAYISPEQIRGEQVTPQSDIYMLGLMLYEIVTGAHPFEDMPTAAMMYKHLSEQVPDIREKLPTLSPAINLVVQRATMKDPNERYHDAMEMASDLRRALREGNGNKPSSGRSSTLTLIEPENPYKGLRAFQQADAADFFGRSQLVNKLIERLMDDHPYRRFLAVVGPSGSGKSSVVKAGVIPALQKNALPGADKWFIVEMVPGVDPMEELEATLLRIAVNPPDTLLQQLNEDERGFVRAVKRVLPDDSSELLVLIDQFEELFTLVEEESKRAHFMNSLMAAVSDQRSRIRVIITLRADFYDRPLNYNKFGELMQQRTEIVLPLTTEEIEQAVVAPAERAGLYLESGLVTAIVSDVKEQPGALPLLQYALTELFERRDAHTLTLSAYNQIGGTLGALAQRADELYSGLGKDGEEAARQLFLRLVTLGEGTEDTRRRVMLAELLSLGDKETMEMAIDAFGRYRLLTFDHDTDTRSATVEVAHEALIRQWKRLRDWLSESREDLRLQRRLSAAAEDWREARKDPSFLARGARLEQFEGWANNSGLALNTEEKEYLDASITEREKRLIEEKRRQEREDELERRSRNVLRALVGVMAVATLLALLLSIFAFTQRQSAEFNAHLASTAAANAQVAATAESQARATSIANEQLALDTSARAQALALAANARSALIENNPMLALSLAVEADQAYSPAPLEVNRVLAAAAYAPGFRTPLIGHEGSIMGVAFNADATMGASVSMDGTLRLWDLATGEEIRQHREENTMFVSVAFSPDGQYLLTAEARYEPATNDMPVTVIPGGIVRLWEVATLEPVREYKDGDFAHPATVRDVAFSPDGTRILTASVDRTITLWDTASGELIRSMGGTSEEGNLVGAVIEVGFSPDGRYAVTGHADETELNISTDVVDRSIRVWNLETGEQVQRFIPQSGFVRAVTFSPDGEQVLGGMWDGTAGGTLRLWDVETGAEVQRIYSNADVINAVAFSADGTKILSAGWDRTLRLWDVQTGLLLESIEGFGDRLLNLAYSADGQYALVGLGNVSGNAFTPDNEAAADTRVWLIDLQNRTEVRTISGHEDWIWDADLSPDGRFAVSGAGALRPPGPDNSVRLWDVETGEQIRVFEGHTSTVDGVELSPDGQNILSGGWDSQVILWDVATGQEIRRFEGHEGQVLDVEFNEDGTQALSADNNGVIILWDVETGEEIRRFEGHTQAVNYVIFNPDGTNILSGSQDNLIILWDIETGEEIRRFEGHSAQVSGLVFTADGSHFISTAWDTTVRLWDVETGQEIQQYSGHTDRALSADISPDGTLLLTSSADRTARLWDLETSEEVRRFEGHTDWISSVNFSPDGTFAMTSAQDKTLRVWRIDRTSQALLSWAEDNRYLRPLSCTEQKQYHIPLSPECSS